MFYPPIFRSLSVVAVCVVVAACGSGGPQSTDANRTLPQSAVQPDWLSPKATLSPTSLSFGSLVINATSLPQTVTLTNGGTALLKIAGFKATCGTTFCFKQTNTCGTQLLAGKSCSIQVTFTPHQLGSATGALSVYDNAAGSPQSAALSGGGRLACSGYGYPCSLGYSYHPCCPGLHCVAHYTSIRAGLWCDYRYATRRFYMQHMAAAYGGELPAQELPSTGTLSVIDTASQTLVRDIAVGPDALSVAITPDGRKVYVTNAAADSVSIVDTRDNALVKTITVGFGSHPTDVAVAKNGRTAYVVNAQKDTVAVIDTMTDTVTGTLHANSLQETMAVLKRCAPGVAGSPDGRVAYVVNNPLRAEPVTVGPALKLAAALDGVESL